MSPQSPEMTPEEEQASAPSGVIFEDERYFVGLSGKVFSIRYWNKIMGVEPDTTEPNQKLEEAI